MVKNGPFYNWQKKYYLDAGLSKKCSSNVYEL